VAYDDLDNRGVASDTVRLTTESDTTAPAIRSFYPAASAFNSSMYISVEGVDNIAVQKLILRYSYDQGDDKNWTDLAAVTTEVPLSSKTLTYSFDVSKMPEGEIFIEAVLYDKAGLSSEPCVSNYKIDRTPPAKISDLTAAGNSGNAHLTWTVTDSDVTRFEIYRAEDGKTQYSKIADCRTKDFYDISAKFGAVYTYKVIAFDMAGNRSEFSNEAIAQILPDTENPKVLGFTIASGSHLAANPKLSVVAVDNNRLSSVSVEYKKTDSDDIWQEIGTFDLNSNYQSADFTWNTDDLEETNYTLKAVAKDVTGNVSDSFTAEYILNKSAPDSTVLTVTPENRKMKLTWTAVESDDFAFYRLYKKSMTDARFRSLGDTQELEYTDAAVSPLEYYEYKIQVYDKYGNFSSSSIEIGSPLDIDDDAPQINIAKEILGISGMEIVFDATACIDNVRIVDWLWDFGNGITFSGPRINYDFINPGIYDVVLTVKDAAGNVSESSVSVSVLDKLLYGNVPVQITDINGSPLPYAYVYMYEPENETERALMADENGVVNITGAIGSYQIAAYKNGYLPAKTAVNINSYGESNAMTRIVLERGELVTGDLSVHRMTLEEMVEAGVDFNSPINFHTYRFQVLFTFEATPIPTYIEYVVRSSDGKILSIKELGNIGEDDEDGGGGGADGGKTSGPGGAPIAIQPIVLDEEVEPALAYLTVSESISFMKDMFAVELGVINNASPEFVIEDSAANLKLPSELSLAFLTTNSNKPKQSMDDIAGQQRKTASWVVSGDKPGRYNLEAEFSGNLMPFDAPVKATFKMEESFIVGEIGEGINIYVYPEDSAYIGKEYYVQYKVVNEGSKTFYNLTTTFGDYINVGKEEEIVVTDIEGNKHKISNKEASYIIPDLNRLPKIPVMSGGQSVQVGIFAPGDELLGTYKTKFRGKGDPDEIYYKLVDWLVMELTENTAIKVHVVPIPSHITKYNVKQVLVEDQFGDPVDMTTGAFIDSITAMTVNGDSPLSFGLNYNSLESGNKGQAGYGWSHAYETRLDIKDNSIDVHWNETNYTSFIDEETANGEVTGYIDENGNIVLQQTDDAGVRNYVPVTSSIKKYSLRRNEDGTYTLATQNSGEKVFDKDGKLIKIIDKNGKTVSVDYIGNSAVITDEITGASLVLNYSGSGLLTSVTDGKGRTATLTYENGLLTSITDVMGETAVYTYDDKGRILTEQAVGEENPFVENFYDENGRVVKQYDIDKNVTYYEYSEDGSGNLTAVGTDRNGNKTVFNSDPMGHVSSNPDPNGNVVSYTYDETGNILSETDGSGNTTKYSYDENGKPAGQSKNLHLWRIRTA
jgi:YD repeat-containing protein